MWLGSLLTIVRGFAAGAVVDSFGAAAAGADDDSDSGELVAFSMLGVASGVATASTSTALAPSQASGRSGVSTVTGGWRRAASNNTSTTQACRVSEPNSEVI